MAQPNRPTARQVSPPKPARSLRPKKEPVSGDPSETDPANCFPDMAPNFGKQVLPESSNFMGIMRTISRTYMTSDEAMLDSRDNSRYMRNNLGIMECLESRQRAVALLDWAIEPEEGDKSPIAKELCDDLTRTFRQTPDFLKYRECLQEALWYGKYGIANRFNWKQVGQDWRLCIDWWRPVLGDKIVYRYDDGSGEYPNPNQVGLRIGAGYFWQKDNILKSMLHRLHKVESTDWGLAYFLEDWEEPLLTVHKHRIEDGAYERWQEAGRVHGVGIRSRIYWEWLQQIELLGYLMDILEKNAAGVELYGFPANDAEARQAMQKAAAERVGNGRNQIFLPIYPDMQGPGMGLEAVKLIQFNPAGADVIKDFVQNYFGARVKRYILGQVLTSEPANSGMGNALAEIQLGTFMMIIRYDAVNLGESITRGPLKFLQQVNHPKYANVPLYFKIKTDTPDLEKKMDAMYKAWQMGMAIPTSEVADTISCRQPKPDEDALRNPAVQQAVPLAANAPPDGTHPSMIGDPTQRLKAELVNALRGVAA